LQTNTIREPTDEYPEAVHVRPKDGFSQIEEGLYALIDERYKSELESLRTMVKNQAAELLALRADLTSKEQQGEAVDEHQIQKLETQIEAERVNRRRLEDENIRLKNRMARLEGGQEAGMNDLQDQIRQLREDMSLR
jgi:predicted  nucleic acid-binding Zn-ribbon protein